MKKRKTNRYLLLLALAFMSNLCFTQTLAQEKMEQLSYLVGEWVGTTKIYQDGEVAKEGSAYEKISYDLDGSILVIELNTEFLQLRTIINYDEADQKYHYHRFSKDGAAVYPAVFQDQKLIVWRDEKTRFFFTSTQDGGFQEYGEKLVNGEWIRTFEDTFINTQ
jgi:hypothetical protein